MELMKTYLEYIKEAVNSNSEEVFESVVKLLNISYKNTTMKYFSKEFGEINFEFWQKGMVSSEEKIIHIILYWSHLEIIDRYHKHDGPTFLTYDIRSDKPKQRQIILDLIVKYFIHQNELEPPLYWGSESPSFKLSFIEDIYKAIDNTYEGQKHWIEKGELNKLLGVKLDLKILKEYPEIRDIKKQTEWS
jgi:hypothetical protein